MSTAQEELRGDEGLKGKSGWGFAFALVVFSLCLNGMLWVASQNREVVRCFRAPIGMIALDVFRAACGLYLAFLFARSRRVREFVAQTGLNHSPSLAGWLIAWVGVAMGLLELYLVAKGWEPQNTSSAALRSNGGSKWLASVFSAVFLAPLYEETIWRGYLYRAFRGSYAVPASAFFVALVVGYFHWGLLSMPLFFVDLLIATIILCLIRERSGSTWNCFLFHAAHNASTMLRWPWYLGGMLAVLPVCVLRRRS